MLIIELLLIALLTMILFALRKEENAAKKRGMPQASIERYWDGAERRRHVRLEASFGVRYSIKKGRDLNGGMSKDICERGMRILADKKLERGTVLGIEISQGPSDGPILVEGMVLWSNEARGQERDTDKRMFHVGIKFLGVKKGSKVNFDRLIRSLESRLKMDKISDGISVNT